MVTAVTHGSGGAEPLPYPLPGPDEIRAQLARVISSPEFPKAGRGAAFLTFVVEEALSGRAHRLKGYTVAIEVFKRSDTFTQTIQLSASKRGA